MSWLSVFGSLLLIPGLVAILLLVEGVKRKEQ
jgi:hypothetical protein